MSRILIVDDSAFVVKSLANHLSAQGHEIVATACDGIEGLEAFRQHRPDLVLLDITMPRKDGKECLQDIIKENSAAKVIIVSATSETDSVMECLQMGALAFIEKPLRLHDPSFCESFNNSVAMGLAGEVQ